MAIPFWAWSHAGFLSHRISVASNAFKYMSHKTPDSPATVTDAKEEERKQPLYEASTQFRNWRYSPEGLAQIREKLNEAAVAAIRNTFELDQVTLVVIFGANIRSSFLSSS